MIFFVAGCYWSVYAGAGCPGGGVLPGGFEYRSGYQVEFQVREGAIAFKACRVIDWETRQPEPAPSVYGTITKTGEMKFTQKGHYKHQDEAKSFAHLVDYLYRLVWERLQ